MLEFTINSTTAINDLKDFITVMFIIVDDLYIEYIPIEIKNRRNTEIAELTDSEIITIALVGETLSIDSEKAWISFVSKNLRDLFPRMCDRSRFNRSRRNLVSVINEIGKRLNDFVTACQSNQRIIDSFPLPVCKFGRAHFCKSYRGYGADYGYCPSKKETYYGFKVHVLCTAEGFITNFVVSSASVDDRAAIYELVESYNNPIVIIGDKGYVSPSLAEDLSLYHGVELIAMKRSNAKIQFPTWFRQLIFKIRRRIETSFSQLSEQFKVETVKAKSLWGLQTRLATKILAFNLCCFINQLLGKSDHLASIKSLVF